MKKIIVFLLVIIMVMVLVMVGILSNTEQDIGPYSHQYWEEWLQQHDRISVCSHCAQIAVYRNLVPRRTGFYRCFIDCKR
ncbi:hypothetical protein [Isachenkonia alkalipeptolytica]|uniref:Uncharacterized protein n=1 Tax=Isachenkonia alkalipeptolytica TaxID=2565777 RepID=A0AA43XJV8_9CLOT|nr:hypothetical protein [Isachenkonia alkalipeptolytica]NBG88173.1 hypothetical protein [Isachenkonia alkalipeptolytica]